MLTLEVETQLDELVGVCKWCRQATSFSGDGSALTGVVPGTDAKLSSIR